MTVNAPSPCVLPLKAVNQGLESSLENGCALEASLSVFCASTSDRAEAQRHSWRNESRISGQETDRPVRPVLPVISIGIEVLSSRSVRRIIADSDPLAMNFDVKLISAEDTGALIRTVARSAQVALTV